MTDPCRIAVVGAGLVGRRHVFAASQLPTLRISAIVDPSDDGRTYAAEQQRPWFASLDDLFKDHVPDGVVLSTPTHLHVEQGLACIERGCPILVEKPLSTSADSGKALVDAGLRSGVPILVGHHRRHNPLIHTAQRILERGDIGDVRAAHVSCWFYKPDDYFEVAPWRTQRGAGPISVNLVHDVDLIRYLCGEVASVQAQAVPSVRGFENEDLASALLRLDNNALVTVTVSDSVVSPWSWEHTAAEYPVYPVTSESCYQIGGSDGALSIPDLTLWTHAGKKSWWNPISATSSPCDNADPLVNQLAHFADVIVSGAEPLVSGLEGLKTLRVVEAIQQAALSNERVQLDVNE